MATAGATHVTNEASPYLVGNYHIKDVVVRKLLFYFAKKKKNSRELMVPQLLLEIVWAHVKIRHPQVDQRAWKIDWQQVSKVFGSSNPQRITWTPR